MTGREVRIATEKVVKEIQKMENGQIKHFHPYKFSISKNKVYYFHDITGTYPAGSASSLTVRIQNAIAKFGGGQ